MLKFSCRSIAWGVAMLGLTLNAPSFGWSISGNVKNTSGDPLSGVKVESFNVSGISAYTADDGSFSIAEGVENTSNNNGGNNSGLDAGTESLRGKPNAGVFLNLNGHVLSIENVNARVLKVSVMDVLGKILLQRSFQHANGNISLNLKDLPRGVKFVRLTMDGKNVSYQLTRQVSLLKTTEQLPTFLFTKDGYEVKPYQMTEENETGVEIILVPVASGTSSSSVFSNPFESSSSEIQTSTSTFTPPVTPVDCSGKTLKNSTTLYVDNRKVIVQFPNNYKGDKPVPMLLNFHPIQGSADGWAGQSQIAQKASADGAINVFPDGADHPGMFGMQGKAWNVGPCCTDADDVTFTRHIVQKLTEEACVDPTRVYAAGFSMGGGMSNYVGCFLADIIAAAAPSAFDLAKEIVDDGKCKPARPFPILNLRGTNDGTVMYDGGLSSLVNNKPITFMGAQGNFKEWAKMDQCTGVPTPNSPKNGCQMYENCAGGAKVGLCSYAAGHEELDPETAWNFLKQFKLQ
jgi:polyhydroxybutyrate depolymerase